MAEHLLRVSTILRAIGRPEITIRKLHRGRHRIDYKSDLTEMSRDVLVDKLNDLPLLQWIAEANTLIAAATGSFETIAAAAASGVPLPKLLIHRNADGNVRCADSSIAARKTSRIWADVYVVETGAQLIEVAARTAADVLHAAAVAEVMCYRRRP